MYWFDREDHLHELGKHFKDYQTIQKIEILPYHQLGVHKWAAMGMEYRLKGIESPGAELKEKAAAIFR